MFNGLSPQIPMTFKVFKTKYTIAGQTPDSLISWILKPHLSTIYNALVDYVRYSSSLNSETQRLYDSIKDIMQAQVIAKIYIDTEKDVVIKGYTFTYNEAITHIRLAILSELNRAIHRIIEPYYCDPDEIDYEPQTPEEYYKSLPFNNVPIDDVLPITGAYPFAESIFIIIKEGLHLPEDRLLSTTTINKIQKELSKALSMAKACLNEYSCLPRYAFLASIYRSCHLDEKTPTLKEIYWCLDTFGLIDSKTLNKHTKADENNKPRFIHRAIYKSRKMGLFDDD